MEERPCPRGNGFRGPLPPTTGGGGWPRAMRAGSARTGRVTCPCRPGRRCPRPGAFGPGAVRASTHPTAADRAPGFLNAGLSGRSRSSGGRAAPLTWERPPRDRLSAYNRGQSLPRMAQSASPPGGAGAARSLWATGRCGWHRRVTAGSQAPAGRGRVFAFPAPFGPGAVRASTHPTAADQAPGFLNAGLSGRSRSSGGRAAPLMRERSPGIMSAGTDRGRRLPRMAQSARPPEGQALPTRFRRPDGVGGTGA